MPRLSIASVVVARGQTTPLSWAGLTVMASVSGLGFLAMSGNGPGTHPPCLTLSLSYPRTMARMSWSMRIRTESGRSMGPVPCAKSGPPTDSGGQVPLFAAGRKTASFGNLQPGQPAGISRDFPDRLRSIRQWPTQRALLVYLNASMRSQRRDALCL